MAELVDALDLKSSDHCGRAGSTPAPGTKSSSIDGLFLILIISFICWPNPGKLLNQYQIQPAPKNT